LFQNAGSWSVVKAMRRALDHHMKNDERILGDDEFIQFVLFTVKSREKIAKAEQLELVEDYKVIIL
jgi:predicted nucleotide-binding protein